MDIRDTGQTQSSFDDFVLEVLDDRDGAGERRISKDRAYSVRLRTPAGDPQASMRLPYDQDELDKLLLKIEYAILWSGGQSRRVIPSERLRVVQDFGATMFQSALSGAASGFYHQSRAMAEQRRRGLRLKLRIEPPELAALPWEFLFDSQRSSFVGLSTRTPIVRDLGLPFAAEPLAIDGPLRILGMVASPKGLDPLDIPREKARVEKALAESVAAGSVVLRWLPGKTWEDLHDEIERGEFHVFHFIGHGGFDETADQGLIALANEDDEPYYLPAEELAMLLEGEDALRLVVLNSCDGARGGTRDIFSSTAAILVRSANCAVVAMQYEITDTAAIAFSRSFYRALADGVPIDAAVASGRQAIRLTTPGSLEWATPVLYQRAPDGVLFTLKANNRLPPLPPQEGDDPPKPPQAPPSENEVRPGGQRWGQKVLAGVRRAMDFLFGSVSARALLSLALGIALLAGLLYDSTPWAIAAAAIGALGSIGMAFAMRVADGEGVTRRAHIFQRALRPTALACGGAGVIAMALVAAGVPGLSGAAADIDDWSLPRRFGAVLIGIGAVALGARFAGAGWPRWASGRIGGGGITSIFLAALIVFLPFGDSSPQPIPVEACSIRNADSPPATRAAAIEQPVMFRGTAARTGHASLADGPAADPRVLLSTGGQIWSSPTAADGRLFVGSGDGLVYGIDLTTGRQLRGWPYDTEGYVYSSPAVADGVVYVGSSAAGGNDRGKVHAIDIATGAALRGWPVTIEGQQVFASPIVRDGKVYVGGTNDIFYIIDAKTGDYSKIDLESMIWSTAAIAGDVAYVGLQDSSVVALDLTNGAILWTFETNQAVISSPAIAGGTVYVGAYDGCVYAIDAERGTERWRFQTGGEVDSSPAVANGVVYVGSWDGNLYALDSDTGRRIWSYGTQGKIWSSPALGSDAVFFSSDDEHLYAVHIDGPPTSWRVSIVQREPLLVPGAQEIAKMRSSPLLLGNAVVLGSIDGNLYLVPLAPLAMPAATPSAAGTPGLAATPVT